MAEEQGNIRQQGNQATVGLNMDQVPSQIAKGSLTYALNAALENFTANSVNYQNELGNSFCLDFPEGYSLIGKHFIPEQDKHIFFLANPYTLGSEIGYMINNDCTYHTYVNAPCLNFSINNPIHKVVHRITNCSTEIYWTDGVNPRRYLNLDSDKIPHEVECGSPLCNPVYKEELDCNQLKLQPDFDIPLLSIEDITSTGDLLAGTYQFAVQYADALGNPFTSYYSVTNPVPIADPSIVTPNFNYPVGKSIVLSISHLDTTGQFDYFNIAVIKTVNAIASVELVGTYYINGENTQITYTGQSKTDIRLSMDDIFEKFPYYDVADDVTTAQDILIWKGMSTAERVNYQKIANQIHLQWETWRIPENENYADEWNATNLRSYLRDEVYAFEIQFLLANGRETDGFHIPGRSMTALEASAPDIPNTNDDFIGSGTSAPYWKIRNTASFYPKYAGTSASDYKGPYQYGEFAYWESSELYPCNTELWGDLANTPIRHHKFPDVAVSPIFESKAFTSLNGMVVENNAVFPIGVKVDKEQILAIINSSELSLQEKEEIVGFRILRGDRSNNKSIVAKGILRNVNKYERDGKTYYFANYPYNDLHEDPFINSTNNAYADECDRFTIQIISLVPNPDGGPNFALVRYRDCNTNKSTTIPYYSIGIQPTLCSIGKPSIVYGEGYIEYTNYDEWYVWVRKSDVWPLHPLCAGWACQYNDVDEGIKEIWVDWNHDDRVNHVLKVVSGTEPICVRQCDGWGLSGCDNKVKRAFKASYVGDATPCVDPEPLPGPDIDDGNRLIFNSPETSFGQPFLGDILKLESTIYGKGQAHFTEVLKNAKYRLISKEAQIDALNDSVEIASITDELSVEAMFASYQAYLQIFINGISRKNYAYSFNSIANYDSTIAVPNGLGIKQRNIDKASYLIPAVVSIDGDNINNWYRESSVYIKTAGEVLPFASTADTVENSRFTISGKTNCSNPGEIEEIQVVSYYASMKKDFINQWGQIYTYNTISTGYERIFDRPSDCTTTSTTTLEQSNPIVETVFGGDTFICRFAFKTKLPFFIDNRVNAPDDSDIFYDEIGNVGYPTYWHSARSILQNYQIPEYNDDIDVSPGTLVNFISYKAHNFDCPNDTTVETGTGRTFYDGYFYLFAYGIPNFYCESSYNIDLRQAFNNREGDFWPHVGTSIPDDWVQESFVSIANDNTYYYNTTYSKQNKENFFSHLPADWDGDPCLTHYPFRAVYSDLQNTDADNRVNAWRIYRATSYYDFPQNFGDFTSIDGIQNSAILARFENKTLLYGNLLTIDTSNPQAAYIGNPTLFKGAPPVDFAETDLGYMGSQHKMLLKIPQGQISIDAKRGHVFLIQGTNAIDISGFGSGMNRFFTDHLPFQILKWFPDMEIDNHYNGIGLHAVYDAKFERVIITKLDYAPLVEGIEYDSTTNTFSLERRTITLEDTDYFCNKSWTVSYNLNTKSWISFHSYLPNFYIGETNFFYSGLHGCCDEFDFIAQTTPITTTSTTTDSSSITTTSSTTMEDTSCDIIGEVIEIDESLTTTTSSTLCIRPLGLDAVDLIVGYVTPAGKLIGSTASRLLACSAMSYITDNPLTVPLTISAYSDGSYILGTQFYANNGTQDCSCIPNGWYFSSESAEYCYVFHVVNCVIVELVDCCLTTTTTTTAVPTTTTTTTCEGCIQYLIENIGSVESPVLFNTVTCNGDELVKIVIHDLDQLSCSEPDSVVAQSPEYSRITPIDCCYQAPITTTSTTTQEVTTTTSTTVEDVTTTTTTTVEDVTTTSTTTNEDTTTTTTTGIEDTTTTSTTNEGDTTTTTTTEVEVTTTTTTETPTTTTTTTDDGSTTTTTTTEEATTTTTTEEPITTTTTTTEETCLKSEYGFLYNYSAVVDERNIAPEGWRVPTEADFDILIAAAGGEVNGGQHLKSASTDFWNIAGDNSTGFGAVGGGVRSGYNGAYAWKNNLGYYHSSDFVMNGGTPYNIILDLSSSTNHAYTTAISAINYGLSVRLIKEDSVDEGYMCDNDNNIYPTVKIGNQVWMAQNLATITYRNGEAISGPSYSNGQWPLIAGEAYCSYLDLELCNEFEKCTTTTTTTLPCDLSIIITDVVQVTTTTTTTITCELDVELDDIVCETTTTTTTVEPTTTTTTTAILTTTTSTTLEPTTTTTTTV